MAEPRGSARRTNLALGLAALLILGASIAVSVLVDSSPATAPSDITVAPNSPGSATRPADTWLSWFDHANVVEQFDHPMETLRCEYLDQYLTNDVCAVAATRHGAFMISGAERDWDPEEMDEDGRAYVPFSLTAWVLRSDGTRRAASILDGWTEKAFSPLAVSLSLHVAEVDGDQVILIVQRLADDDADPFDYPASMQIIAMSPSGAPTLVAAYEGIELTVREIRGALMVSSWRFGPEDSENPDALWCTHLRLSPSGREPYGWDETPSSGPCPTTGGLDPVSVYRFPVAPGDPGQSRGDSEPMGSA